MRRRRRISALPSMAAMRFSPPFFRQPLSFIIGWTQPQPVCPWILPQPRLFTVLICQRPLGHSSEGMPMPTFRMEYRRLKFLTTNRTCRSQPLYISPISPRVQFRRMPRWKAPPTRLAPGETDMFWSTWKRVAETTLHSTRCGRESTKTVPGPIPRMLFGPTWLRMPSRRKGTEQPMPRDFHWPRCWPMPTRS